MNKVAKYLKRLDVIVAAIILLAILVDVILQVLSRILPGNAIPWTVEVGEMLLGAIIWLGISAGIYKRAHVRFDLVLNRFSSKGKFAFQLIGDVLFLVYTVLLANFTRTLLHHYTILDSKSTILGISMYWVRMPIFVGCIVSGIRIIIKQYNLIRNRHVLFSENTVEQEGRV